MNPNAFSRSPLGILLPSCVACLLGVALFIIQPLPAHAGTTIDVDTTLDELLLDGHCSLREAIWSSNSYGVNPYDCAAGTGEDIIILPSGTYTITRGGSDDNNLWGDLDILRNLEIRGAGSGMSGATTINANGFDRVFDILSSAHVTLTQMIIQGGNEGGWGGGGIRNAGVLSMTNVLVIANYTSSVGGGLSNDASGIATLSNVSFGNNTAHFGGGIYNAGKITLTNVSLGPNAASSDGGGLDNFGTATLLEVILSHNTAQQNGGGIHNGSGRSLTLDRVSVDNNDATNGNGGGIWSSGKITLTNVTLSANKAVTTTGKGGGIFTSGGGAVATITNATVYTNAATSGGGIYRDATSDAVTLRNTIIANSPSGGNCGGSALTSEGYNLDSANTCGLSFTGDLTNTPPYLGALTNNGGWMTTHALLPGSPAINKIPAGTNGCGTTITTDQRRATRPIGNACDIGAYEAGYVFLPLIKK